MPAKDYFHNTVKEGLEQLGWKITHDPYYIRLGRRKGFIDLGAELIAAERDTEKIAVEIKSFLRISGLDAFEDALGQYLIYQVALEKKDPQRNLWLAIPNGFYESFFDDPFFIEIVERFQVQMLLFNEESGRIIQWRK